VSNPVVHFEIMSKDSKALKAFYTQAFGWDIKAAAGADEVEYGLIERNGQGIGGGIGSAPTGYDGHLTFYVGVPKIEDALSQIVKLGGSTMMGPIDVPNGPRIALFRDPQNNVVGLVQCE
jgi:uncharacterized protein